MPIRAIQAAHLLAALRKIEARGAPTVAARARFLSSEICDMRHAPCGQTVTLRQRCAEPSACLLRRIIPP